MTSRHQWELPRCHDGFTVLEDSRDEPKDLYSVKFCPYVQPGEDPVFAVVGGKRIFLCNPPATKESSSTVRQLIVDDGAEADYYACVWSQNVETGAPWLCVAGMGAVIHVIDALTGQILRTLAGHGGEINDLVVSPTNSYLLASASVDCTVRLWTLDPARRNQPCVAILEGEGHKETVLTLSFHETGPYLLTAGIDHVINLWTLPDAAALEAVTMKPIRIHYPHFSTSEIHSNPVDCIAWHGDLILSRAANESCIVLWTISSFSGDLPAPDPSTAPTIYPNDKRETRSAFCTSPTLYTRLFQLHCADSEIMWMRFSLFPGSVAENKHPILAICNTASKVYFWDLNRFEEYYDVIPAFPGGSPTEETFPLTPAQMAQIPTDAEPRQHPFLFPFQRRNRGGGMVGGRSKQLRERSSSNTNTSSGTGSEEGSGAVFQVDWKKSREGWAHKYYVGDAWAEIEPHAVEVVKGVAFTGRQCAWSRDGKWCVVVGSMRVVAVLGRWGGASGVVEEKRNKK